MLLSIIIPIFNEEKTAQDLIKAVFAADLKNLRKEIIIIDDASSDKTPKILESLQKKLRFKYLKHKKNQGKGAAIRTGLKESRGEIILIQDADLEYDPKYYDNLLKPILDGKTKIVYGNRFANYPLKLWGKDKTVLPHHWVANRVLTGLTNILYKSSISDMETGYKVFKKEVLDGLNLKSNRFEVEVEFTAKVLLNGHKIYEIPIKTNPRTHKQGKKISWKDGVIAGISLIKYRFKS